MMSTKISCYIANHKVIITDNAVKTNNNSLQIELVKRLIDCKSIIAPNESALPLFYNKYLKHYPLTRLEFLQTNKNSFKIETWSNSDKIAA